MDFSFRADLPTGQRSKPKGHMSVKGPDLRATRQQVAAPGLRAQLPSTGLAGAVLKPVGEVPRSFF